MKFTLCILLLAITALSSAWVARSKPKPRKDLPGDCYVEEGNLGPMKFGDVKQIPGKCVQAICSLREVTYFGCGAVANEDPKYRIDEDLSLPYPKCCPTLIKRE